MCNHRDFESPDETRTPDKTKVDIVRMGGTTVGRFAFEPGWRWSDPDWAEACALKMTTNPWTSGVLPRKTVELIEHPPERRLHEPQP